jgi:hypothetical protein
VEDCRSFYTRKREQSLFVGVLDAFRYVLPAQAHCALLKPVCGHSDTILFIVRELLEGPHSNEIRHASVHILYWVMKGVNLALFGIIIAQYHLKDYVSPTHLGTQASRSLCHGEFLSDTRLPCSPRSRTVRRDFSLSMNIRRYVHAWIMRSPCTGHELWR